MQREKGWREGCDHVERRGEECEKEVKAEATGDNRRNWAQGIPMELRRWIRVTAQEM